MNRCTREYALKELNKDPWSKIDSESDIRFVAYKLNYSVQELNKIIKKSPLWYVDFSNREMILGFAYNTYRLLTGREKNTNF